MTRGGGVSVFSYSARHRWAYVPTLLFLVIITLILVINPTLIWNDLDPNTRRSATLLAAALATGFAVVLAARWASPFRFTVGSDALVVAPLIGSPRRIAYREIRDVQVMPKTFMRSVPEVVLKVDPGRPVVIRTDITGYQQLERTLRRRLAPDLQARWKEARDT